MEDVPDLKTIRERLGWTQEQMAEHLGLDRSSVSRMENGQPLKGPTRKLLEGLAQRITPDPTIAPSPEATEAA